MYALQTPVGQLVAEIPERARVFEEFDIDYCCGGKRTLGEACSRRGIDPEIVLKKLDLVDAGIHASQVDWRTKPLPELCDHIVATHHQYLRRELPRLQTLLAKIARVHGERHPELIRVVNVFEPFQQELDQHMDKEEQVLFPLVKRLAMSAIPGNRSMLAPIRVMESEHDQAGAALEEIRRLTNGYQLPPDACTTYRVAFDGLRRLEEDMHLHVHLENNILFRRAERLISGNEGGVR
jgi:regulator of cell morphogenesis and NO signaling